jgi:drug/metabolite transporter (DMT)-like permease
MVADFAPMTTAQIWTLVGAGAMAALGQFGVTAAYRFAEPRAIAAWDYTNILFAALFGLLLFGQIPDVLSAVGFVAIVASALMLRKT